MKWGPSSAIVVDITPSQVTFSDMDGAPFALLPVVYVAPDHRRKRILGVGAAPPPDVSVLRVDVFGQDSPPAGVSKFDCLAALFIHGLKTIVDRSIFRVRPEVLVRGAETIKDVFGGYERDLLKQALEKAGARRVRWPDEFVPD